MASPEFAQYAGLLREHLNHQQERRSARFMRRYLVFFTTPLVFALFIGGWQLYVPSTGVSHFLLPQPRAVWEALKTQVTDPFVWRVHVKTTFVETVAGLGIGIAIGVASRLR